MARFEWSSNSRTSANSFGTSPPTLIGLLLFLLSANLALGLTVVTEDGAMVYFQGELVGVVKGGELTFNAKLPGVLRVVKPGYVPYETIVETEGRYVVNLKLPAFLEVRVTPPNAEVFVNNERYTSGVSKQVPSGQVRVIVRAKGYTEWSKVLELKPLETTVVEVRLKQTVTLNLSANVTIDEAYLDGIKVKIPGVFEVRPGKHELALSDRYSPTLLTFDVPEVSEFSFEFSVRKNWMLTIKGYPEGALVKVGGGVYRTPAVVLLPEGRYDVEIQASGFKPLRLERSIFRDEVLDYVLEVERDVTVAMGTDFTVELNGFTRDRVHSNLWFTRVKDKSGDTVWFGFSSGVFEAFPTTLPLVIGPGVEAVLPNGLIFKGPTLVQVQRNAKVLVTLSGLPVEVVVAKPTVVTTEKACVVNVFSRSTFDVYVNGELRGRTPIYLLPLAEGDHVFTFKRGEIVVDERRVSIRPNVLNEVKVDK